MPNKLFNNVHAGDTMKFSEGKKGKGRDIPDSGGRQAPLHPTFKTGLDSETNQNVKFGMKSPGSPRKK